MKSVKNIQELAIENIIVLCFLLTDTNKTCKSGEKKSPISNLYWITVKCINFKICHKYISRFKFWLMYDSG